MNYKISGELHDPDTRIANQPKPGETLRFRRHVIGRDPDGSLWVAVDGGHKQHLSDVSELTTVQDVISAAQTTKMPLISGIVDEDERPLTPEDHVEQYERNLDQPDASRVPPTVKKGK
jgi:hypothetical protein